MRETYKERSILDEICNIKDYDDSAHRDLEYIQIGKRIWLPIDFIKTTIEITNAQRLIQSVTKGEKRFFINHISDSPLGNATSSADSNGFSINTIRSAVGRINSANHIFVPNIDAYTDQHREWFDSGLVTQGDGMVLDIGNGLELHWIPEEWGHEDIYLIDSDRIDIIQKTFEDAPMPKGMSVQNEYNSLSTGERLMIYFGESMEDEDDDNFDEKVDFFYRVVLSEPRPSPGSIHRIEAPEKVN
ncbi:hypothetical protein HTG_14200 [Natrinema mahii]|nr:hypothetical protein HTG_14200 [Natrinema mahii]